MPPQQEDEESVHGQGTTFDTESSTTASENPAVFGHQPAKDESEASPAVVDIETALKAGTVTANEAIVLMEQQMKQEMKQMQEKLTQQFASQGAPTIEPGVHSVIARLANAPCNWHQATVYYASSTAEEDASGKAMALVMFAASVAMVLGQILAVTAVGGGMMVPTCASSDMCSAGRYCSLGEEHARQVPRCKMCGGDVPFGEAQVSSSPGTCTFEPNPEPTAAAKGAVVSMPDPACETLNLAGDPNFVGYNTTLAIEICAHPTARIGATGVGEPLPFGPITVAEWCTRCVHPLDGTVDPLEFWAVMRMNVDAMDTFDWATLWFASFVIALKLAGELKDIYMCDLAIARADKLSVGWLVALRLLGGVRRWCFVPELVGVVGWVVILEGGDALSICCETMTSTSTTHALQFPTILTWFTHTYVMHAVNTVALLFLTEIDNMAYALGLSEQARRRVEVEGRVELSEEDTALLLRSKIAHMIAIVAGIFWIVASRSVYGIWACLFFSWVAGVVASITPSVWETAKGMARATVASVAGAVSITVLMFYSLGIL